MLTNTTPSRANRQPRYHALALQPAVKPPPWIHQHREPAAARVGRVDVQVEVVLAVHHRLGHERELAMWLRRRRAMAERVPHTVPWFRLHGTAEAPRPRRRRRVRDPEERCGALFDPTPHRPRRDPDNRLHPTDPSQPSRTARSPGVDERGVGQWLSVEETRGGLTFVFTDIEGSTRLVRDLQSSYGLVLRIHRRILETCFTDQGGKEMGTEGDALC